MRHRGTSLFLLLIVSLGLRAIACGGSKDDGALAGGGTGDGSAGPGAEGGTDPNEGGITLGDGAFAPDTAPPVPPSYCQGITFYATYDQTLDASVGAANPRIVGVVALDPGHFGGALSTAIDAGADAAIVYYDNVDGAAPIYDAREGTIAFWFKPLQTPPPTAVAFVRPIGDARVLAIAGPSVASDPANGFGLYVSLAGIRLATLQEDEMAPFRHPGDFDHFVTTWRLADDAGAGGVASLAVNGGLGEVLTDGGFDASFVDAATDDAGNYRTPYAVRRSITIDGRVFAPFQTLRAGGSTFSSPRGDFDELTVWNRMLTEAEVADLYRSPTSIRDRCNLP